MSQPVAATGGAPVEVAVALGANLGSPADIAARFTAALARLEAEATGPVTRSSLYRSAPVGPVLDQPEFLNAVAVFAALRPDPRALLGELLAIEAAHGRERALRGGPRPLDLDLLWVGDLRVDEPSLTLPHPRMLERRFVLAPLAEVLGAERVVPGAAAPLGALLAGRSLEPAAVERLVWPLRRDDR